MSPLQAPIHAGMILLIRWCAKHIFPKWRVAAGRNFLVGLRTRMLRRLAVSMTVNVPHDLAAMRMLLCDLVKPRATGDPMADSEPREVFQGADANEAYLVRDALEQAGIEAIVVGDMLQGALGLLPITDLEPRVLVADRDYEHACKVLADLKAIQYNASRGGGRWRCSQCGEMNEGTFELCWNCGCSRDTMA